MAEQERLQKYLARAGIASRRHCEELIAQGHVAVNGVVVQQLGVKVDPDADVVTVDSVRAVPELTKTYVVLNKPQGYVTTAKEQRGRPAVLDLLQNSGRVFPLRPAERQRAGSLGDYRLFPVGRLDIGTEGLLILTNDGEMANRLTHPRYALEKEYLVRVKGKPTPEALRKLREGVELDGKPTAPARADVVRVENGSTLLRIVIHEGRKRQVRLMLDTVGHPVEYLIRTRVGPLELGNLPTGRYRFLTDQEVNTLKRAVGLASSAARGGRSSLHSRRPSR